MTDLLTLLGENIWLVAVACAELVAAAVLAAWTTHPQDYYDFILMDVQMPVMDGRTAARNIRALNRPDVATVLIFAISADAFVEDERLSREAGMNAHYAKPVKFAELQRDVGRFLREKERNRT